MPVMDEFKSEREAIKNAGWKEKTKYFFYYYKWHVVVIIGAAILAGLWIHDVATQKENALFVALLNSAALTEDAALTLSESFADYAGIDLEENELMFDSSMTIDPEANSEVSLASAQRMMVYTASGELDALIGGEDVFPNYAYNGLFTDLRPLLSKEQLAAYEPYFYYIDQSVMEEIEEAQENMVESFDPDLPDPTRPEDMENPVPIGIFVSDCPRLNESYYFMGRPAVGVMANTSHPETALSFIDFLFESDQ